MGYPSANRDQTRFADPDRFDSFPCRTRTSHSAVGLSWPESASPHRCSAVKPLGIQGKTDKNKFSRFDYR